MKTISGLLFRIALPLIWLGAMAGPLDAQVVQGRPEYRRERLDVLEKRIDQLENRVGDAATTGMVLFLFGAVAALWAQHHGRDARWWFLLGFFLNVFALGWILIRHSAKNAESSLSVLTDPRADSPTPPAAAKPTPVNPGPDTPPR
jgi:hypothetical protein